MKAKNPITEREIETLEGIDVAILRATTVYPVELNRLRKYVRNWATVLNKHAKEELPIRCPQKK